MHHFPTLFAGQRPSSEFPNQWVKSPELIHSFQFFYEFMGEF